MKAAVFAGPKGPASAVLAIALFAVACGKIGPPQAPLRPVPVAVVDLAVERSADRIELKFTVPDANLDDSTPVRIHAVHVFALTQAAAAPAPTAAELAVPSYVVAMIQVRSADDKPDAMRPLPGGSTALADDKAATVAGTPESPKVRYYAVAGVTSGRRGPPSKVLAVPLSPLRPAPEGVALDYTESTVRLSWTSAAEADRFIVEEVEGAGGAKPKRVGEPLTAQEFTAPVEFGRERCFTVRTAEAGDGVLSIGAASPVHCVTPVDKFPPAPPQNPNGFPGEGAVDVLWTAPSSKDVAGYIVLRGEGASGTLQPLFTTPITATQYRDQSVKAGVTYSYQIVAIDAATPANHSEPSARVVVTAR